MRLMAATLVLTTLAIPTFAQQGRSAPAGRPPVNRGAQPPSDDMSPGQLHQLFDAMLVMQAQNALSLTETQYAAFLTRLKELQDTRRRNQLERVRLINELQRMTNPRAQGAAAESEIKQRLAMLHELESRAAADLRRAYDALDGVLNPVQQARFRVLEEQIERRKLELVGRARQNNQKRPPRR